MPEVRSAVRLGQVLPIPEGRTEAPLDLDQFHVIDIVPVPYASEEAAKAIVAHVGH